MTRPSEGPLPAVVRSGETSPRRRIGLAAYGAVCYAASLASLAVVIGWLGGPIPFPVRLDEGSDTARPATFVWNTAIMIGFALYHSFFARTSLKQRLRPWIGRNLERATYNLVSAVLLILLCLLWEPVPTRLWELTSPAIAQGAAVAHVVLWIVHLTSIVLMNHNDFFGLRQVGLAMRGEAYRPLPPISRAYYLGTRLTLVVSLILIPWAAPVMTVGRLHFAVFMTGYIVLGAWLSNRDRGDVATLPDQTAAGAARVSPSRRPAAPGPIGGPSR